MIEHPMSGSHAFSKGNVPLRETERAPMTDHVLTEAEVDERERLYQNLPSINHDIDAIFSSHRLQAARIQELEKRFVSARQVFEHYQVPLDGSINKMVDENFWDLLA